MSAKHLWAVGQYAASGALSVFDTKLPPAISLALFGTATVGLFAAVIAESSEWSRSFWNESRDVSLLLCLVAGVLGMGAWDRVLWHANRPELHFKSVEPVLIDVGYGMFDDMYRVGAICTILNAKAEKAYVVDSVTFDGSVGIGGNGSIHYIKWSSSNLENLEPIGKYYLPPAQDQQIKVLTEQRISATPGIEITLSGPWKVSVAGYEYEFISEVMKPMRHISADDWEHEPD